MSMQPTPQRYGSPDYSPRRPRIILVGLIVLCGFFVYGYNARLAELDQVEAKSVAVRAHVDTGLQKQAILKAEYTAVGSEAEIEDMARKVLDYVKPGDKPLTLYETAPVATEATPLADAPALAAPVSAPVWQQWVDFFASDQLHLR